MFLVLTYAPTVYLKLIPGFSFFFKKRRKDGGFTILELLIGFRNGCREWFCESQARKNMPSVHVEFYIGYIIIFLLVSFLLLLLLLLFVMTTTACAILWASGPSS